MAKIKRIILSYSVLDQYRRCGLSAAYHYRDGLVPVFEGITESGSPLAFGSVLHKGLEALYKGNPRDKVIDVLLDEASKTSLINIDPTADRSIEHARELMEAYLSHYQDDSIPNFAGISDPLEKEIDFVLQSGTDTEPEIVFRVHIDRIAQFDDGTPFIMEHKTSSGDLTKDLVTRMEPNNQSVGYSYVLTKTLGLAEPIRVMFNGLTSKRDYINETWREKYRQRYSKKGEIKEPPIPFFRHLVQVSEWQHQEWFTATLKDCRRFVEDLETDSWSNNAPNSCTLFNRRCPFTSICKVAPSDRPHLKEHTFNVEPWKGFSVEYR